MKYGLVFAGGGARGAYHVGVMHALNEMNIEISAVCGTSIGAINGALFVQNGGENARELWEDVTLNDIVKLPEGMGNNLLSLSNLTEIIGSLKNGGFDAVPLEKMLRKYIDEDKIRKSEMDFGLVSVSLTNKKTVRLFKNDIPKGKLPEYLAAGSALPVFKNKEIDGERFMDGGISDNMPVDMLADKGIKDIITVDIHGVGIKQDVCTAGTNIIEIVCESPIVGTMEFDRQGISDTIDMGYYDTKKVFGYFSGSRYYFETRQYNNLKRQYGIKLIEGLEQAAEIFGVKRFKLYDFKEFARETVDRYRSFSEKNMLEALRSEAAGAAVIHMINLLKDGKNEFIRKKLDIFGKYYNAAGSLMYFERIF